MTGAGGSDVRRRRRRLALWSAVPAVLALAVAVKLLSVGPLSATATDGFAAGRSSEVLQAASSLGVANVVEPHKALFASGDAHVLASDFEAARRDFEASLQLGAGADECKVRVNLVLSIEKLGDAAKTEEDAALLYTEGLGVLAESPAGCRRPGAANTAGEGQSLSAAQDRLNAKLGSSRAADGRPHDAQDQAARAPAEQEQLHQLGEKAQQAQRERAQGQEREQYLRSPDGQGVDRPW
ncbi:hypothetical protein ACIQC5_14375 [Paenarthrobacter sp. NPDC092416]|uniref:hypothetical protein n=1 Tax=Paenarthrobacter sp. NPDC092416 TaxID=3364386 RepID=UPI00381EE262